MAPLRIEVGRYFGEKEEERICRNCDSGEIENEEHCLTRCDAYIQPRTELYHIAQQRCHNFIDMSDIDKLGFILSNDSMTFISAKTCQHILKHRLLMNTNRY